MTPSKRFTFLNLSTTMKREYPHPPHPLPVPRPSLPPDSISSNIPGCSSGVSRNSKAKMSAFREDDTLANNDAGVDEELAALGYKVKSSDMADVAQRLKQLEEVMGNVNEDGAVLSQLASESIHYNPSDMSNWLENMLSEFNPAQPDLDSLVLPPYPESSSSVHIFDPETPPSEFYDLKAIPGQQVLNESNKRLKPSTQPFENNVVVTSSSRPVVLVDTQESGIRLVHTLMACAEAIQQGKLPLAQTLVNQIGVLATSQAGAMRKVVTYFHQALSRRIYGFFPQEPLDPSLSDLLQMHFYETCPYLKFAHFTANQAILEAFSGKKRVHVIDFSMNQGMQWPALMQALALRPGGPPVFRLTGIGPPSPDKTDRLQEVGWKLAQFAETIHVEFEYRGFVAESLADLDASMLELRPSEVEAVAVNSIFELHRLLAWPGAIEKVLQVVKEMKPVIATVVEQEANHNGPVFLDRFTESLHYYSTLFDSLEGSVSQQDMVMSEVYLGRQICNVVACEGPDRLERHETLEQWRTRFATAGFAPHHLGSNAYRQASMLLALFAGGDGYRVEENDGCLMLGWHTRPLIATSAWKFGGPR